MGLEKLSAFSHLIHGVLPSLQVSLNEMNFLQLLLRKTIAFDKITEDIPRLAFECGILSDSVKILPPIHSRPGFYKARRGLVAKRIIFFEEPDEYTVNVYGLLDLYTLFIPSDPELVQAMEITKEIYATEKRKLQALADKEEIRMDIDEAVKHGNKKFITAMQKRAKKDLSPLWVEAFMREVAAKENLGYISPISKKEKIKVQRCAKNWLAECKRDGFDPKGLLRGVTRLWRKMGEFQLFHREYGTEIKLNPAAVSFLYSEGEPWLPLEPNYLGHVSQVPGTIPSGPS